MLMGDSELIEDLIVILASMPVVVHVTLCMLSMMWWLR